MRILVQRVLRASVTSRATPEDEWETVGSIGSGLCLLVGVTHDDDEALADKMADKVWGLRIFEDAAGVMNRSVSDVLASADPHVDPHAEQNDLPAMLVVSQFTLYGDTAKGRRPSWINAARPEHAEPLVERVVERLRAHGCRVETGRFRSDMRVELVNDGPCTILLEL